MRLRKTVLIAIFLLGISTLFGQVKLGVDVFFDGRHPEALKGKKIGLITNQTGVNAKLRSTIDLFLDNQSGMHLVALFAPEHGLDGAGYANEKLETKKGPSGIPVHSLYGKHRRPTEQMLKNIDVLVYDIQDIGCRSYTYATTLYYVMEEAAKKNIQVIVFDRPNPINGVMVDGPMLDEKWRSFIGYINVPYCHGMTIGELATFFNQEYQIGCDLKVIPMQGWKRNMSYSDTHLSWVPTSPYIPEPDTPLFYASTGILGELEIVNIGIGYTLPFKVVGAPWIHAKQLADQLNQQKLPGVRFVPFHFRPFYGAYKGEDCQGILIRITNKQTYRPLLVQYMMIGLLKSLYPKEMNARLARLSATKKNLFCKANGNEQMFELLSAEKYVAWKLAQFQTDERAAFLQTRNKYLKY